MRLMALVASRGSSSPLRREATELSTRLLLLLNRVAEMEHDPAPPIAPSIEDMVFSPTVLAKC